MDQMVNGILKRAIRVVKLEQPVYREIARDANATKEAAVVVAVVALASGIGALSDSVGAVIVAVLAAFIGWVVFAAMTYFFGKNIFGAPNTQVDVESLLRTQGYAQAPGVLAFFGFIPVLGWIAAFIGGVWAIITAVVAIRETLVIGTGRAILVGIVAAIASGLVVGTIGLIFGIGWAF